MGLRFDVSLSDEAELEYLRFLAKSSPSRAGLVSLFPGEAKKCPYPCFEVSWSREQIAADRLSADPEALCDEVRRQLDEKLNTPEVNRFFERFSVQAPFRPIEIMLTRYGSGGCYYHPHWAMCCNLFHLFPGLAKPAERVALKGLATDAFGELDLGVVLHELVHLYVAPVFEKQWGKGWNQGEFHFRVEQTVDLLLNSGELAALFPLEHKYHCPAFFRQGMGPVWGDEGPGVTLNADSLDARASEA